VIMLATVAALCGTTIAAVITASIRLACRPADPTEYEE